MIKKWTIQDLGLLGVHAYLLCQAWLCCYCILWLFQSIDQNWELGYCYQNLLLFHLQWSNHLIDQSKVFLSFFIISRTVRDRGLSFASSNSQALSDVSDSSSIAQIFSKPHNKNKDVFDHLIDLCGKKNFDARHIEKTVKDAIIPAVSRGFAKAKGKTLTIYLNKDKLLRCKSTAS